MRVSGSHKENITPMLLENSSPSAMCVGRRCAELGFGFYWKPFARMPTYVCPKGEFLPVEVEHYIPYLVCESVDCAAGQLVAGQSAGENIVLLGPALSSSSTDGPKNSLPPMIVGPCVGSMSEPASPDHPPINSPEGEDLLKQRRDLKQIARSKVHLLTHNVANPYCLTCRNAKMIQVPFRIRGGSSMDVLPTKFGQQLTADHLDAKAEYNRGLNGEKFAIVLYDRGSGIIACYPVKDKSGQAAFHAMNDFEGHEMHSIFLYR